MVVVTNDKHKRKVYILGKLLKPSNVPVAAGEHLIHQQ